ncbi:MAG: hypothetical protein Q3972_04720 [Corynebacterium sp.]|nr:hypothetical protein [Corynebacterium sp.]
MKFTTTRKIALSGAMAFAALTGVATAAHADEVAPVVTVANTTNPVDEARAAALATLGNLSNLPTYKVLGIERSLNEATSVEQINTIIYNAQRLDARIDLNSVED